MIEEIEKLRIEFGENTGINFLINEEIIKDEIDKLEIKPDDIILEIGPGIGNIIEKIQNIDFRYYIGIELNEKLYTYLIKHFDNDPRIVIIKGDASEMRLPYFNKVISNLPFYAADKILKNVFKNNFKKGVFILPESFINKLKEPKNYNMLYLSAFIRILSEKTLDPSDFYPIPHTKIGLIEVERINDDLSNMLRQDKILIKNLLKKHGKDINVDYKDKRIVDLNFEQLNDFINKIRS